MGPPDVFAAAASFAPRKYPTWLYMPNSVSARGYRMQIPGAAEQLNMHSPGLGGAGGGNQMSENRRGFVMADPPRNREGKATSQLHQIFRVKSASSASLGSKLRTDQSFESLASAFAACVHTQDGDGDEATQGIAQAFGTRLHISQQTASKDQDMGRDKDARLRGAYEKAFNLQQSFSQPFSQFPARVDDLTQRGDTTRRVSVETRLPTKQKARSMSAGGSEVRMDNADWSSSLDSNVSSSESEDDTLASEFASSILLGGKRQASITEPEIVAAMEQLWRMKDGIRTESRSSSVSTRSSQRPAQPADGGLHSGQVSILGGHRW